MFKTSANDYFKILSKLLLATQVTANRKVKLTLNRGIAEAIHWILGVKKASGKIMLIGNGGSAAIASHEAIDFWRAGGVEAMAFNDPVQLTCISNDFGYENVFAKPIGMFARPSDLLIAISSSGRSLNILKGVEAAKEKKCGVITFSGFAVDNPLRSLGNINFYIDSHNYGHVELAHLSLIHSIADMVASKNKKLESTRKYKV